jgi:hypothetical protein
MKKLGSVADVERRCVALATLDAILCDDWESRYYSFNSRWNKKKKLRMGSMRNGEGDEWFALFFPDGRAAIKGFAHEAKQPKGILDDLPKSFAPDFLKERAFSMDNTTFCLWSDGDAWITKGKPTMLELVAGTARDYAKWAKDYFGMKVDAKVVQRFFAHEPLTPALARALNRDVELDDVADDLKEIGYPRR